MASIERIQNRKTVQLYESLKQIPQHNWRMLGETGNLRYLIKKKKDWNSRNLNRFVLEEIQLKLTDEYFSIVGDDPDREELMIVKKQLIIARALYAMGDNFQINNIKIHEGRIASILSRTEDFDADVQRMMASKWMGGGIINEKKITAYDYIKLIKAIQEDQAMQKESMKKKPADNG